MDLWVILVIGSDNWIIQWIKVNIRVGNVNVWPVPHIHLLGLRSILMLCEQAKTGEYGVLT